MIPRGIDFPYIHDLAHLLSVLKSDGQIIPEQIERAADQTSYATVMGYLGITRYLPKLTPKQSFAGCW